MEKNQTESEETPPDGRSKVHIHVLQDLDYVYRDVFNVYVGTGDVVIELGNHHRSMPGHATISNRIVMSMGNAYNLQQALRQALQAAQEELQKNLQEQARHQKTGGDKER